MQSQSKITIGLVLLAVLVGGLIYNYKIQVTSYFGDKKLMASCLQGKSSACDGLFKRLPTSFLWKTAIKKLERQCVEGNTEICRQIGGLYLVNVKNIKRVQTGTVQAMPVSFRYLFAKKYFRLACEQGDIEACYNLLPIEPNIDMEEDGVYQVFEKMTAGRIQVIQDIIRRTYQGHKKIGGHLSLPACGPEEFQSFLSNFTVTGLEQLLACSVVKNPEAWNQFQNRVTQLVQDGAGNYDVILSPFTKSKEQEAGRTSKKIVYQVFLRLLAQLVDESQTSGLLLIEKIVNLAHFVLDIFYAAKPFPASQILATGDLSFLLPVAFSLMLPSFFDRLAERTDLNRNHLLTLLPVPVVMLFPVLDPMFFRAFTQRYRNSIFKIREVSPASYTSILAQSLFYPMAGRQKQTLLMNWLQLDKQVVCNELENSGYWVPPDQCAQLTCGNLQASELLFYQLIGSKITNINCWRLLQEKPVLKGNVVINQLCYTNVNPGTYSNRRFLKQLIAVCPQPARQVNIWLKRYNLDVIETQQESDTEVFSEDEQRQKPTKKQENKLRRHLKKMRQKEGVANNRDLESKKDRTMMKGLKAWVQKFKDFKGDATAKEINRMFDENERNDQGDQIAE